MKGNRYNLVILFITMMIVNIGFGVILPILPYYAQSLGASATTLGLLSATYATLQFFFAPLWGRLSDRVGRRPVLLAGLIGFSVSFLIFGLSTRLWMLFLARIIGGLLSSATLPTVLAFIADTTRPENRARGMGLMGAAGGIGMILGPALGGFMGAISPQAPFFLSAGLAIVVAVFAFLLVPETYPSSVRAAARAANAGHPAPTAGRGGFNRFHAVADAVRGPLAFLMILAALTSFGMAQLESTAALFAKARFGAGEAEMGAMFMLMGCLGVFAQFVLVARVIHRVGERRAIQISLTGMGLSMALFGVVQNYPLAMSVVVLMGLTQAFLRPALNTLVSRSAPPSEQGVTMGLINSFYSLGMMFGPVVGGMFFDHLGIAWPFFSSAIIHTGALLATVLLFTLPARGVPPAAAPAPAPQPPINE